MFKENWGEGKADCRTSDLKIFVEEKTLFYQVFFVSNEDNINAFNELYQSFRVWWVSIAGRHTIERSIEDYVHNTYGELSISLPEKEIIPQKELDISLVYDECLLVDLQPSAYFAFFL